MLTADSKRHIDAARQVLVGKIPDPKSQVQEITNALIYKFMDDMDELAASVGGKRRYFTGEYEKYSWRKIMDPKVGAFERIGLYTEALARLSKNPNLPELFRSIFEKAYLPFNDGRTLTLFLQEVDYFNYKNSEELGNAYEYLLGIMGSQGDAGQFRTPRHIIDFIVKVIDPGKNDSVLDPACGTAGFLISAYKHVISKHDGVDENGKPASHEKALTADEKKRLYANYHGFDIDDNMVKMAKVNMYLHSFPDPKIIVHDTLSSEDFWNDRYDVMFANPPFMTPKGGIQPHSKFGVQSNRSEVLFVDYIMNHLKPNGRAGIIVPEGIIFQSGKAHRQLRKNLIEDGLFAVVSLPGGVFNPYSGVKTSILLFDNSVANKVKHILFVKITNDGFDLGAQRRLVSGNDLPMAIEALSAYRRFINSGQAPDKTGWPGIPTVDTNPLCQFVSKEEILNSEDYSLLGGRYASSERNAKVTGKWQMVELGEILKYEQPTKYIVKSTNYNDEYTIPVLTAGKTFILGWTNEKDGVFIDDLPVIIFDDFTTATKFVDIPFKVKSSAMKILLPKSNSVNIRYIFLAMQKIKFTFSEHKRFWISEYSKIKIPLPPFEVQKQIVDEIDGYQKIIDGAKQIIKNWKPKIEIDPKWKRVKLEEICDLKNGYAFKSSDYVNKSSTLNFRMSNIKPGGISDINYNPRYLPDNFVVKYKEFLLKEGDLVVAMTDLANDSKILGIPTIIKTNGKKLLLNQRVGKIVNKNQSKVHLSYLSIALMDDRIKEYYKSLGGGGLQVNISKQDILSVEIPLPSLDIQKQIVGKIDAERAIIESAKKLIEIYEQKTKKVLDRLWEQHK